MNVPFGASLVGLMFFVFLYLLVFGLFAGVAALVAPYERRLTFFLITFFFLGPLGIGFASVATTRPPRVSDTWTYRCERCGAAQNIEQGEVSADCYRCGDTLF
jgi:hypothetical protein